ncbi:hypothetical protein Y032_0086g1967 [Ancylostoma ceylanicum]|uniref:Uncharacterized protein n=1 Tax=Ancylostoma ceylanicum TaxID=53326 RepID=A0A016TQ22_9BILA|nr:hypothetical protein Y032_0086g1967 [Ancylostoma ceylanicum]
MEEGTSNPSTSTSSDHLQSIKDFNLRKFDKLVKKMGRKLLPKPCDTIFVPSAIPSCSFTFISLLSSFISTFFDTSTFSNQLF